MSAALTHAAVGVLLGLALGIRLRWIPLAALLAVLPDADHVPRYFFGGDWPILTTRVTFHNLAFCLLLPLAAYVVVKLLRAKPEWTRLAAAAPLLMTSHLFLDTLPLDVSSPKVPLLYPFAGTLFTASSRSANAVDPTAYGSITLLILVLAGLVVLTVLANALVERRPEQRWRALAFAGAWLLVFPALFATGFFVGGPTHAETSFAMDSATLRLPEGRFTAIVYHLGGNDVGRGQLRVQLLSGDAVLANATNNATFSKGQSWVVDAPLATRPTGPVTARLVAAQDGHEYARAAATLIRSHFEAALSIAAYKTDPQGRATLTLQNGGPFALPAGALRVVVQAPDGTSAANVTLDKPFAPGTTATIAATLPPTGLAQDSQVRAIAVEDGFVYLNQARRPDVTLPGQALVS